MKDKNIIGLIKYLSSIFILSFLPPLFLFLFALCWALGTSEAESFIILNLILGGIFLIIPFAFLILPIVITTKAIKNHWSEYLDKFFQKLKILTVLFLVSIIYIYMCYNMSIINYNYLYFYIYVGLAPTYIIVYLTIIGNFIHKKVKDKLEN